MKIKNLFAYLEPFSTMCRLNCNEALSGLRIQIENWCLIWIQHSCNAFFLVSLCLDCSSINITNSPWHLHCIFIYPVLIGLFFFIVVVTRFFFSIKNLFSVIFNFHFSLLCRFSSSINHAKPNRKAERIREFNFIFIIMDRPSQFKYDHHNIK